MKYLIIFVLIQSMAMADSDYEEDSQPKTYKEKTSQFSVYFHPWSSLFYDAANVYYVTLESKLNTKLSLVGQFGSESGAYTDHAQVGLWDSEVEINEMEEYKLGLKFYPTPAGFYFQGQLGYLEHIQGSQGYLSKYQGSFIEFNVGYAHRLGIFHFYHDLGFMEYFAETDANKGLLAPLNMNFGIGFGF